jgi:uncharacterized membrane protein YgcG
VRRILLLVVTVLALSPAARAEERILGFDSLITVRPTGDMEVSETIRVVCEGDRINHGIFRDFPTRYEDGYGNRVSVAFEVKAVLRDGQGENWWTEPMENGVRVYIGQQGRHAHAGEYTYTLTYRTDRQLGFFADHDELYWNVTGNGWEFAMDRVGATVELPPGAEVLSAEAYTGLLGEKGQDYTVTRDELGRPVFTTTRPLTSREGLTIVVSWPKGLVREPSQAEKARYFLSDNKSAVAGAAGIVVLLAYYVLAWLRVGRDPARGTIIPLYEAPRGFSPAAVRYVMRMGFDHRAFAAAIVNMAVKGVLSIDEDKDGKYTLTRKGTGYEGLSRGETKVAQRLFGSKASLTVETANHSVIAQAIKDLSKSLAVEYEKLYFLSNRHTLVPGLVISVLTLGAVVALGRNAPVAMFMTLWLSGWTAGCAVLVYQAFRAWRSVLFERTSRIVNTGSALFMTLFSLPFLGGEVFGLWLFTQNTSMGAAASIFFIVLLNILFYHLMKAPTIKGRRVMDQIEGLKLYRSVAEKDRLTGLNPPEKTPEVFERFLPYALALDVEQAWGEQFADVLARARAETGYAPAWYSGTHFAAAGAAGLASGLGSLSSSIASSSSPPGSSSGGGGGGSSGGGGGGGAAEAGRRFRPRPPCGTRTPAPRRPGP